MGMVIPLRGAPQAMPVVTPTGREPKVNIGAAAFDHHDYHRTQQEAGIDKLPWNDRLPPLQPAWKDYLAGAFIVLFLVVGVFLSTAGQP